MEKTNVALETKDIQGMIISGYGDLRHSAYLFLHFKESAATKQWLEEIVNDVTTAYRPGGHKPTSALNIAFTYNGLETLQFPPKTLTTFPHEFVEGMAARAVRLGDNGSAAPEKWEIHERGKDGQPIHALLILQAREKPDLDALCEKERMRFPLSIEILWTEFGCQDKTSKEHFGFRDSIANPEIEGSPKPNTTDEDPTKPGEFILGYPNEYGLLPPTPIVPGNKAAAGLAEYPASDPAERGFKDFGRNGSYLVFRKLHQDVAGFRAFFQRHCRDAQEAAWAAAKFVGRWPSGAPLTLTPEHDDPSLAMRNDFRYAETDSEGTRCPIAAHIRRTNPRDALVGGPEQSLKTVARHRLMRRGTRYGDPLPEGIIEDDHQPRGILFLCLNADLERQFEFVQQTWINNPRFAGLYNDRDPLCGDNLEKSPPADAIRNMTIPGQPVRRRFTKIPRFVFTRGGAYFFMPGKAALRYLSQPADS